MSDLTTSEVDAWIAQLYECKPLSEQEIKRLTEKVRSAALLYNTGVRV